MTTNIIDQNYLKDLKQLIINLESSDEELVDETSKEIILEELKKSYNQLFLYDLYKDKELIAVTGTQGAGKTMLVRELFDIPEGILPENNSRGEKLPVFISESNVEEPVTFLYYINKEEITENHVISKQRISHEDFKRIAMTPTEDTHLWLECVLPSNLLNDENKTLVLLPGYEKVNSDFSQKLLDFIIQMSKYSIMVVDKNTYARKSSTELLGKIEKEFKNHLPIVVLTHGDQSPNSNEQIRESVLEDLNVENPNRVIITGRTEIIGSEWKEKIISEIEELWKQSVLSDEGYSDSFKKMIKIQDMQNRKLLRMMKSFEKEIDMQALIKSASETSVNHFKSAYTNYLKQLEKQLTDKMNTVVIEDKQIDLMIEKYVGFGKSLKKIFVNNEVRNIRNFKKDVVKEWTDSKYGVVDKTLQIAEGLANDVIGISRFHQESVTVNHQTPQLPEDKSLILESKNKDNADTPDNKDELTESNNDIVKTEYEKLDQSIYNIAQYFLQEVKSNSVGDVVSLNSNDYDVLVFMGAQFLNSSARSLTNQNEDKLKHLDDNELENITLNTTSNPLKNDQAISIVKKAMLAVPAVLSLDVLIDGKADILQNLLLVKEGTTPIMLGGLSVSAATLTQLSLGIMAVGSVAFVATQAMKDVNNSEMKYFTNSELILGSLRKNQVDSYVENQKNIFLRMEQKLIRKENSLRGADALIGQMEEIVYLTNRIQNKNKELLRKNDENKLLF